MKMLVARPVISAGEAAKKLALRSPLPPFRKVRMARVELVYLPHYLFDVRVKWKREEELAPAAVDAVLGYFALWKPEGLELEDARGREFEIPFILDREQAQAKLVEQYRWRLISLAMKMRRRFEIRAIIPGPRIYYPFSIGYYRSRGQWKFEVIDALSGGRQGGKVRDALLAAWLNRSP